MHTRLRLGDFDFDPATGELTRDGAMVRLEPQPAAVLAHLASRSGELVTRDQLARLLWTSDTHVNFDEGVNYAIRRIRLALGDDARAPRFIETIPKRGYRLLTVVHTPAGDSAGASTRRLAANELVPQAIEACAEPDGRAPARFSTRTPIRGIAAALAATLVVAGVALLERRPNRHHELTVATFRALHDALFGTEHTPSDIPH